MNKVIIIGRWTKDIELRFAAGTGKAIANSTVAVDRNYKGQDGQKQADFIPVVMFGKLAENVANRSGKGRLVGVAGRIQTSSYDAQDGTKRYKTEVIADEVQFLDWPKDGQQGGVSASDEGYGGFEPVEGEDDVPF